jgi:hypothetical protein
MPSCGLAYVQPGTIVAIFHKIACRASLEATAAIIAITARSTVMFTIVYIFRGDGAHDLLLSVILLFLPVMFDL